MSKQQQYPNAMTYEYKVRFEKLQTSYRLISYNTPWEDCERELEDIKIMMEGKDLENKDLHFYKCINWENLELGFYECKVVMSLIKNPRAEGYEQYFKTLSIEKVEKGVNE